MGNAAWLAACCCLPATIFNIISIVIFAAFIACLAMLTGANQTFFSAHHGWLAIPWLAIFAVYIVAGVAFCRFNAWLIDRYFAAHTPRFRSWMAALGGLPFLLVILLFGLIGAIANLGSNPDMRAAKVWFSGIGIVGFGMVQLVYTILVLAFLRRSASDSRRPGFEVGGVGALLSGEPAGSAEVCLNVAPRSPAGRG